MQSTSLGDGGSAVLSEGAERVHQRGQRGTKRVHQLILPAHASLSPSSRRLLRSPKRSGDKRDRGAARTRALLRLMSREPDLAGGRQLRRQDHVGRLDDRGDLASFAKSELLGCLDVIEETSRCPPASISTFAIASPCVILATVPWIWFLALSGMSSPRGLDQP
jgi:hypothetical protein